MARHRRLHVPNGLYYVVLRGDGGRRLFRHAEDYWAFYDLIPAALKRGHCRLHAFCCLRHSAHFAVQVSDIGVCRFVQHLTTQYSKHVHLMGGRFGRIFAPRHRARLVDPTRYLVELVRYIHRSPLRAGLAHNLDDYRWSSHRAYLGEVNLRWLTTHPTLARLKTDGQEVADSYRACVLRGDDPGSAARFERGHPLDSRIAGDDDFVAWVSGARQAPRPDGALQELIDSVAAQQGVKVSEVFSPSRRRTIVLARALVTWRATRCELATLDEIASWLGRHPTALRRAVERCRARHPTLFAEAAQPRQAEDG